MKYTSLINKRTRLFSRWLLPYVLILMIPLLINSYAFNTIKGVVHKQTVASNKMILNQIKQNTDKIFSQVRQTFVQLYFLDIFESTEKPTPYGIHNAVNQLKNISSSYPFISQIILYNSTSDSVITSSAAVNSKSYYESFNPFGSDSYKDFMKIMTGNYNGTFTKYEFPNNGDNLGKLLVFQKTMTNTNRLSNSYNVFIIVNNNVILDGVSDSDTIHSGLFVMLDNQLNQVITSSGNFELNHYIDNIVEHTEPDEKIVSSSAQSDIFDISYYMLLPESSFWKEEYKIQGLFVFSILFCLLMGVTVIAASVKTNYNPVKNLAEMLQFKNNKLQAPEDINSIYTGISDLMEQYSKIMSTQSTDLRTAFLQRFIRGREDGKLLLEHFKTYDITFASDKFAVVLIYIEDFSEFFAGGAENMSNDQKFRFAHLTITNIFEELCANFCQPYYVDLDYTIGYIINFKPDINYLIADTLKQVQNFVKEHFAIYTSIAISDTVISAENVPLAYNQALETLDYKEVIGTETVIEHSQIVGINNQNFYYPLDMEQQLLNCIKAGEYENAQNILDTIYKNNFEKQTMTLNTARCLLSNMISTMIKALNAKSGSLNEEFFSENNYIERLFECKTIHDHKFLLTQMLQQVCEYNKDSTIETNIVDKITDHIKNNYKDINLNVAAVAEHFDFHPTYISNMFKKQTGQGLLDFIKEVRVDAAKKLLKEENDIIDTIAGKCGFSNSKTFTRAFKSVTGLTPGKYKELG